jgi:hypothetical protein
MPSDHEETRDCSTMHCWWVTSFFVFLHDILHVCLSAGLAHISLQGYWQLDADAWVSSYKQTDQSWPPIFRTIWLQQRDHSFRYSVFLQLQSWLCVGIFCKRTIFCVSYMQIHVLMPGWYSDNESLNSDIDITTTSLHKQLRSSTGSLTPHFPHPFFLTSIKTIFITVWD